MRRVIVQSRTKDSGYVFHRFHGQCLEIRMVTFRATATAAVAVAAVTAAAKEAQAVVEAAAYYEWYALANEGSASRTRGRSWMNTIKRQGCDVIPPSPYFSLALWPACPRHMAPTETSTGYLLTWLWLLVEKTSGTQFRSTAIRICGNLRWISARLTRSRRLSNTTLSTIVAPAW